MPDSVAGAVGRVRERVAAAAQRSGRDEHAVTIVAAVKQVSDEKIVEAVHAGIVDIGVNRARDLRDKAELLPADVRWHFIGPLQTNKVRYLDPVVLVHSLDRPQEAEALDARGERNDRSWDVLIEVNIAGEDGKQGVAPGAIEDLLDGLSRYPRVRPRGFMFMAPQVQNAEDVRWIFAEGKRLRDRYERDGLQELSMGMSEDFEVAVEEGATIVRIGRSIFAPKGP